MIEKLFRLAWFFLAWLPVRPGSPARRLVLRFAGAVVEKDVEIGPQVRVLGPRNLTLGRGVGVARGAVLDARGGLVVDSGALIGFDSVILTHTHGHGDVGTRVQDQGWRSNPVRVGRRAWLGCRVIVLPGCSVGNDAIVGAGSVVTREVGAGERSAGSPAKRLR
jgi:acetyltransferase-like isoleucine patch superfamily enzyme